MKKICSLIVRLTAVLIVSLPTLVRAQENQPSEITVDVPAGVIEEFSPPSTATTLIKTGDGTLNLLAIGNVTLLKSQSGLVNVLAGVNNDSVAMEANGGQISFAVSQKIGALAITAGGKVELAPGGNLVLEVASLSIDVASGGALDLTDNTVVVNYSQSSPFPALTQLLMAGLNLNPGGYWDGPGIRSSTAAADPQGLRAVGVLDNNSDGFPAYTHFPSGHAVGLNSVIVTYTWYGDTDLNFLVDADGDFNMFLLGYNGGGVGWAFGDFDYNGAVTDEDFMMFLLALNMADGDGDGIPDHADSHVFDYYNAQPPVLLPLGSANRQMAVPGSFLSAPLRIFLRKAGGESLANAPVTFSLNGSPGYLALSPGGNLRTTLAVRTDETGELPLVYYCLPHSQSVSATITVTAGSAVPVSFIAFSDTDSDGMPDVWEDQQGLSNYNWYDRWGDPDEDGVVNVDEYRQGTDPYDPLNGEIPVVAVQSGGNQLVWKNGWLAEPLIVTVARANGDPVKNVTLHFSAANAGFSSDEPGAVESRGSILLQTDEFGRATARFHAPDVYLTSTSISVRIASDSSPVALILSAVTLGNRHGAAAPFLTVDLLSDGRNHLHWTDNSSDENAFVVERREGAAGAWVPIAVVPLNNTDFIDPALLFKADPVSYRVVSTRSF